MRVPEDLTVTGFDGIADAERLGLTTVRQPVLEKGRAAGRAVVELVAGRRPDDVVLGVQLSVGTTTGPAPR